MIALERREGGPSHRAPGRGDARAREHAELVPRGGRGRRRPRRVRRDRSPSGELVVAHSHEEVGPGDTDARRRAALLRRRGARDRRSSRSQADAAASGTSSLPCGDTASRAGRSSARLALRLPRAIADADGDIRTGITIPRRVFGISARVTARVRARAGLGALRRITPSVVRPLLAYTRASAVVIHHSVVTERVRPRGAREGRGRRRLDGRPPG